MAQKQKQKTIINWEATSKQLQAWEYLHDRKTNEILFGGAGGGGKSLFGCAWIIISALKYKGTRWAIGREELKTLKESTLNTFWDVCRMWNLKQDRDYRYNQQDGTITFVQSSSVVYLKELKFYPTDPDFDYLGSTEYTGTFIDEASQVTQKARNVLRSRIRYRLQEYGLVPKQLLTCNPHKGHLYTDFYKPWKIGQLPMERQFVQALPGDNPYLDPNYIKNLNTLDRQTKERLLFGNWEYDDDPATLCDYDAITDIYTNILPHSEQKYIIADIARFGDDRTVISYWEGWDCKKIMAYKKLPTVPDPNNPSAPSAASKILEMRKEFVVPLSHVLVDEDGVGGGVKDYIGCNGFMGGRVPFRGENYLNLRCQCYYYLAKRINERKIAVRTTNTLIRQYINEELELIKAHERDKDSKKLKVMPKELIKKILGRSPDFADTLMMRGYFDMLPKPKIQTITLSY